MRLKKSAIWIWVIKLENSEGDQVKMALFWMAMKNASKFKTLHLKVSFVENGCSAYTG